METQKYGKKKQVERASGFPVLFFHMSSLPGWFFPGLNPLEVGIEAIQLCNGGLQGRIISRRLGLHVLLFLFFGLDLNLLESKILVPLGICSV